MKLRAVLAKEASTKLFRFFAIATAGIIGVAVVSASVFAALTASTFNTTAQSISSGTLSLTQVPGTTYSNGLSSTFPVSNLAIGDTFNRYLDLTNAGTLDGSAMTAQITDSGTYTTTLSAASVTTGTATFTSSTNNVLKTGDTVTISGSTFTGLTGTPACTSTITVTNSTTFTCTAVFTGTSTGGTATAAIPTRMATDATNGLFLTVTNCSTGWTAISVCPTATVTAASASAGTITYTSVNTLAAGDQVTIAGLNGSVSITGITAAGGVVTYATANTAGLSPGQSITVAGATTTAYNGVKTILAVNANTNFTVTSASAGATSAATGTYTSAFNLVSQTVASATGTSFTVTSATTDRAVAAAAGTATPSINAAVVLASTPESTLISSAQSMTTASLRLSSGSVNHLKLSFKLGGAATTETVTNGILPTGSLQGQTSQITLTFTEPLRTPAVTTNS